MFTNISHGKFINSINIAELTVCDSADSFLQSAMWGRFKSRFGWQAKAFSVDWESGASTGLVTAKPLLTLSRRIAPGISMTYIPWGPELPASDASASTAAEMLTELARALRPFLHRSTAFIRFDPPWFTAKDESLNSNNNNSSCLKRSASNIQPPDTVLIDLTLSCDDILKSMKPKWRYNTGLAEKRGVVVRCNDEQDIENFYRLLTETAERDGIAVHSIGYYQALFEECRADSAIKLHLYTAAHEGDTLAAIVVLCRKDQAVYLYGASSNLKRNLMAPYALQWKAMQDAKAAGCTSYDLFGIPPDDNPDHPMAGLYRFKTGFGGKIIHRPGCWDYPCKPAIYALFTGAERLRKKFMDRRKRRT